MRRFAHPTTLADDGLVLALAPGLGPEGPERSPSFFHGFATRPQVLARALVTLADITATRYFRHTPVGERDPILSAHGDRLRAECFSACNGIHACLEVMGGALDGGEIGRGTTNVDLGPASRALLTNLPAHELLHLDVGDDGLRASTPSRTAAERPVDMPSRWVPALGNVAQILTGFSEAFRVPASGARAFLAALPPVSATSRPAWLTASGQEVRVAAGPRPGAVPVPGIHRLSALKRLLPHAEGLVVHRPDDATAGALVALELPAARVTVALTDEAWRGFSGEGSLLGQLAGERAIEDAEWISAVLAFEPVIDVAHLARETGLDDARVHAGLAVLAASGRVGWDPHERAYFHRELPDDPDRVTRDNPRLTAARQLVAARAVRPHDGGFVVGSGEAEYAVAQDVLPRWANRVLDVAVLHQEILAEATRRGHVPSEAWAGVHELAARKGSGRPGRWRACCHLRESPLRLAASPRGVAGPAVRFRRARPSRAASTPRVEQLVKSARMMG